MEPDRPIAASRLHLLASKVIPTADAGIDLVEVVDFLNKTLKKRGYTFGASKNKEGDLVIIIYETD